MRRFRDRHAAGKVLAEALAGYAHRSDVIVLGLPRGGVPVADEVAAAIEAPLDVFIVRKLGAPCHEELAIGALASDDIHVLDRRTIAELGITDAQVADVLEREGREIERRDRLYRGTRPFPDLAGKVVILVDDGLATGATMRVAVEALKARRPATVIAAAPVASREACEMLRESADLCVCVTSPEPMYGVGMWYDDFSQTSDDEVIETLARAASRQASATAA
jgi:predicted phosphoribosyltransferase